MSTIRILPDLGIQFVQRLSHYEWYVRFYCGCAFLTEDLTRITKPLCPFHTPRAMTVISMTDPYTLKAWNKILRRYIIDLPRR